MGGGGALTLRAAKAALTRAEEAGEEEDAQAKADDGQEAVIHSYITGMLTNFKALPLDRIHNMLKMFVTDPPYTKKITVRARRVHASPQLYVASVHFPPSSFVLRKYFLLLSLFP
jgi:ribosomal protein S2